MLRRVPLDATSGLHVGLPDYVSGAGAPFASLADYAAGLERLLGFTAYVDSLVGQLKDGQRLGYHQPRVVEQDVLPAYRRLAGFLKSDYLPQALEAPGRWAMKDGERLYAAELQHHTTVDVTFDALPPCRWPARSATG